MNGHIKCAMRELWRSAGGRFHGPHIETGTMPENTLLPFLAMLVGRAESAEAELAKLRAVPAPSMLDVLIRLRDKVTRIPHRKEYLGGQQFAYVRLCEVIGEIDDLLQSAPQQTAPSVSEEWREKLLAGFPLLDEEGLCQEKHHCEWTLLQDRKRLHAMLQSVEVKND